MKVFFLDVELQKSVPDAGGWTHLSECGISVAVALAADQSELRIYTHDDLPALRRLVKGAERVIGYNIMAFDRAVLAGHRIVLPEARCLDMLAVIKASLGFGVSLDAVAEATLGISRVSNGLANIKEWRSGRVHRVIENCCNDVMTMARLYRYGCAHRRLYVTRATARRRRSIPIQLPAL